MALMDTVIPCVRKGAASGSTTAQYTLTDAEYSQTADHLKKTAIGAPQGQALDDYLAEKASDIPRFEALLKRTLVAYSREDIRKNLLLVLSALK